MDGGHAANLREQRFRLETPDRPALFVLVGTSVVGHLTVGFPSQALDPPINDSPLIAGYSDRDAITRRGSRRAPR